MANIKSIIHILAQIDYWTQYGQTLLEWFHTVEGFKPKYHLITCVVLIDSGLLTHFVAQVNENH